jgi:hypothetical protein
MGIHSGCGKMTVRTKEVIPDSIGVPITSNVPDSRLRGNDFAQPYGEPVSFREWEKIGKSRNRFQRPGEASFTEG